MEKNQALAGKGKVKDELPQLRLMRLFFTSLSSQFLYLVLYCPFDIGVSNVAFILKIFFLLTFSGVLQLIFVKLYVLIIRITTQAIFTVR